MVRLCGLRVVCRGVCLTAQHRTLCVALCLTFELCSCSAASSGGGSAEVSQGAAGGPAEGPAAGAEGGGAGGEECCHDGGTRAPGQTHGGKNISGPPACQTQNAAVVTTVISQQGGCGFKCSIRLAAFLCGVCMFSRFPKACIFRGQVNW